MALDLAFARRVYLSALISAVLDLSLESGGTLGFKLRFCAACSLPSHLNVPSPVGIREHLALASHPKMRPIYWS